MTPGPTLRPPRSGRRTHPQVRQPAAEYSWRIAGVASRGAVVDHHPEGGRHGLRGDAVQRPAHVARLVAAGRDQHVSAVGVMAVTPRSGHEVARAVDTASGRLCHESARTPPPAGDAGGSNGGDGSTGPRATLASMDRVVGRHRAAVPASAAGLAASACTGSAEATAAGRRPRRPGAAAGRRRRPAARAPHRLEPGDPRRHPRPHDRVRHRRRRRLRERRGWTPRPASRPRSTRARPGRSSGSRPGDFLVNGAHPDHDQQGHRAARRGSRRRPGSGRRAPTANPLILVGERWLAGGRLRQPDRRRAEGRDLGAGRERGRLRAPASSSCWTR